jgi:hypothetical protein
MCAAPKADSSLQSTRYRNEYRYTLLLHLIKRKFFFNATELGRFLDPFEDAEYALGIGGLLDNYDNKKCRARPCVASQ